MKQISVFLLFVLSFVSGNTFCQSESVRKDHFNVKKNVALEGYDPVSYFDGKPTEGSDNIKLIHNGITYHFTTQNNLAKFKNAPDKYEPGYGGWCAYAMGATGEKVKIDPETYTILNGKLYLFYNFWGNNTLVDWKKNEQKLKEAGDLNWRKFVQ